MKSKSLRLRLLLGLLALAFALAALFHPEQAFFGIVGPDPRTF